MLVIGCGFPFIDAIVEDRYFAIFFCSFRHIKSEKSRRPFR